MTGMVMEDATESTWIMSEENGHSHELAASISGSSLKEEKQTDSEIVQEMAEMFFEVDKLEEDSRSRGYSSEDMYMNKQWMKN